MLKCDVGIRRRPSICLSHTGTLWSQMLIGSCGFYHLVAQVLVFLRPTFITQVSGNPLAWGSNETRVGKNGENIEISNQ